MKIGWLALALLTGLIIPAQPAVNAKLRIFVLNPLYSSLVNFCVGMLASLLLLIITMRLGQPGNLRGGLDAPWWAWCGGLIGASVVIVSILCVPRIGAASLAIALVAGQLIGALAIDQFGWLGLMPRPLSTTRLCGALLLLVSVWLMQRE